MNTRPHFCQTSDVFCEDCRRCSNAARRLFECGEREGNGFLVAHRDAASREGLVLVGWEAFDKDGVALCSRRVLGRTTRRIPLRGDLLERTANRLKNRLLVLSGWDEVTDTAVDFLTEESVRL